MAGSKREEALKTFRSDARARVMLIPISCGAVGIDLTVASREYLMEPQWNPMLEEQALDRLYRMGQTREVTTIRYIIKDSFEEVET
ncbi:MAG: hypothetical protein MMC33_008743 [Icmadophila ericetorum]|nr:hypothetical protein [Icmadophila ericetorum]